MGALHCFLAGEQRVAWSCWSIVLPGNGSLSARGKNALAPLWGVLNAFSKQWPPLMISKRGNEPLINYDTWLGYLNCCISSKISGANSPTRCVWFDGPYSNAALHTSCFMCVPFAVTQLPSHYREHRFPPCHFTTLFEHRSGDRTMIFRQIFFPWNANAFPMKTNTGLWL